MKIQILFMFVFITLPAFAAIPDRGCDYIGCDYVGVKYVSDPLGEGRAPDTDPLIRFDAFDCMTFVETALAGGDLNKLNKIRYKNGKIDFLNRNHFTELDWLVNNKSLVKNISDKFGKTTIRTVTTDKQTWLKTIHNIDINIKTVKTKIKYIPYNELGEIKTNKELMVLFIIDNPKLSDKIGTDLAVSHMGFVLPGGILRHASSDLGSVVDVDLADYIYRRAKNKTNLGVALFELR